MILASGIQSWFPYYWDWALPFKGGLFFNLGQPSTLWSSAPQKRHNPKMFRVIRFWSRGLRDLIISPIASLEVSMPLRLVSMLGAKATGEVWLEGRLVLAVWGSLWALSSKNCSYLAALT